MRLRFAPIALLLSAFVFFPSAGSAAEPRPTRAAFRKAFELGSSAIVEVAGKAKGPGVILSTQGHVVTSLLYLRKGRQPPKVRFRGKWLDTQVVLADEQNQLAVLALPEITEYPTAAVKLEAPLARGEWIVAIERTRQGRLLPKVGQLTKLPSPEAPFLESSLRLPPGSPLLDKTGKVLAVVLGKGPSGSALPVTAVRQQLLAVLAATTSP